MNSSYLLIIALIALIILSAFFSGSETGMMSLNRYRLRHLMRKKNRAAKRVYQLLERPDRLLGVILIGNTFANIFASAIATVIAVRLFGDVGVILATIVLTLIILIFAEITPKTVAAFYPERTAFPASLILKALLNVLYPLVWVATTVANGLLRLFNIKVRKPVMETLTHEEMRTVVHEAMTKTTPSCKHMMLGVLDLGDLTVDDIKIPRNEIIGIDIEKSWQTILNQLTTSQHTRLPIYRESIDQVQGMLHLRRALNLMSQGALNKKTLLEAAEEIYFIPQGTTLNVQLLNFRQEKKRIGLIVDEYGDIQGLVTLEDILEEIVGEFTTGQVAAYKNIRQQKDGSYLVDGSISIREINRALHWDLPMHGPKTISGLIVEYLETIPESNVSLRLAGHAMEVTEIEGNTIKQVRILPESSE